MTIPPNESVPATHAVEEPPLVHRVELAISYILRIGVLLSISLVVIGTCLTYVHHPEYATQSRPLNQIPLVAKDFPHTVADTWQSVIELRGQGCILLGLLGAFGDAGASRGGIDHRVCHSKGLHLHGDHDPRAGGVDHQFLSGEGRGIEAATSRHIRA